MGSQQSIIQKCNFEDIQTVIKENNSILINTLKTNEQNCLIKGTIKPDVEEKIINDLLSNSGETNIFIYGKNYNDNSIYEKYRQLSELGIKNIFVYCGGLFEWLCLQDIYGDDVFPTTIKELDFLKFKPVSAFKQLYLTN